MQLKHDFTLPIPPAQAWSALQDLERIAPCMPGAILDQVEGEKFSGRVTLKVGPLKLAYRGVARIVEKDVAAQRLVIKASGRETRGSGTADATITASLATAGEGTDVSLLTDLDLTGRPAQFGRGLISDVGGSIIGQFAERLKHEMAGGPHPVQQLVPAPSGDGVAGGRAPGGDQAATRPRGHDAATAVVPSRITAAQSASADNSLDLVSLIGTALGLRGIVALVGVAGFGIGLLCGGGRRRSMPAPYPWWPVTPIFDPERR